MLEDPRYTRGKTIPSGKVRAYAVLASFAPVGYS
jgi:hypothetical protein